MEKSVFQRSAVVSGLLAQDEFDRLQAELTADGGASTDERLAERLMASGRLNAWQVEQLRNGRTKFSLGPNYHVIDSIGQGGMGQVFKAEHTVMGRLVAIKVLPSSRSTPEAIAGFRREIRTLAQLDHPHLVRAYDAGQDRNTHFLVTEYVPGTDLRRLVRAGGPLSMQQAASIISQSAAGLEYAHGRGLIHRDVKPANLLVTPEGHVKVLDLGLAGFFNTPEADEQFGGKVVGTADYLAPEVIMHPESPDRRSDIYSLGCTLYYAVTGKVPFPGGTMRDKARLHCQSAPIDPRRLNPSLADDFVDVIAGMMAKRPDDRTSSAAVVIERLRPWTDGNPSTMPIAIPVAALAQRKPVPPSPLGETEPHDAVYGLEPLADESTASTGSHPSLSGDETMPSFSGSRSQVFLRRRRSDVAQYRSMLLVVAVATVVILSVLALKMLFQQLHP